MENQNRSSFTGKIGFVLAAAGSAVGLGNIWRFPYLAAKYGGGIFLLTYLILAVTFGFALMTAEIALGRKTGLSVVGAFSKLNRKFSFLGYLAALVPAIILPYYSVIGGWVTKYFVAFISGKGVAAAADSYFGGFTSSAAEPVGWFFIYIGLTALVVLFGVEKGIEKVSKIMMPVLVVLSIVIAGYALTIEGALDGVKYYLTPNFSKFSVTTVLAAMGQLFYSMSLAMGIMVTYGSYMRKDVNLESSVKQIEFFDTGIAFLAGLMIIPVLFAALTSSISLMETVVSIVCDKLKWSRKVSCAVVFLFSIVMGLLSCLGYSVWSGVELIGLQMLDFFDFVTNSVMMPIVAFFTCVFVGYVIKPEAIIEEVELTGKFKKKALFTIVIKYIAPICIIAILVSSVLDAYIGIF